MDKPTDDLELWRAGAQEMMPMVVALRREIHKFPELGLHLPETTRRAREALAGLDVEIAESTSTSSLIVTLKGARQGPTILLRGDMDALPMPEDTDLEFKSQNEGRMHACGHDSHTAMLVGAVHLLHRHRDRLGGNVKFFFQTGEEGYHGARHVIEEGMLDAAPAPTAAFAIHISPNIPTGVIAARPGPLMAATDTINIEIKGKGGHASQPHYTRDPVPVACELVTALQSLVTRRIEAFDPVVLSITKISAGTTSNVVPESARLLGTLRSFSEKSRTTAREGIARMADHIARAHDMEAIVDLEAGYPVTINDDKFVTFAKGVVTDLLGEKGYLAMPAPIMGAEDFSYVLQRMPGCMMFLGVTPHDVSHHHAHACHSNRMMMDEDAMANGIALHCAVAERFLAGE
ncbi:MAG TPA: M20 family metallopeptidase [Rhizomicrobium sp.]|jgi:hippurate hydrolase|nr:M20 family metallopeptidase [Rhizomicrobium sp.]